MSKRRTGIVLAACAAVSVALIGVSGASDKKGEALFKEHCASCHPDGGNIVNPKKTLKKGDLHANNIRSKKDIVAFMRKPGPGMLTFDEKTISNHDAEEIAEYILKKFAK